MCGFCVCVCVVVFFLNICFMYLYVCPCAWRGGCVAFIVVDCVQCVHPSHHSSTPPPPPPHLILGLSGPALGRVEPQRGVALGPHPPVLDGVPDQGEWVHR